MNTAMQSIVDSLSRFPMCLSDPVTRSEDRAEKILQAINNAGFDITVAELAVLMGVSDTTIKKVVKILTDSNLIDRRMDGVKYYYSRRK